jgi:hypothetical protein
MSVICIRIIYTLLLATTTPDMPKYDDFFAETYCWLAANQEK